MQPQTIAYSPLHIRPVQPADVEPIYRACQDPLLQEWTASLPVPYTRSDAEMFVNDYCPTSWTQDIECTWGIEAAHSREFLGVIGLKSRGDGCSEVGYWLAPAARGRGIATRALAAVCRFAWQELGQESIIWQALVGNEASRRVAERVGFQVTGPVRRLIHQRGQWVDGWVGTLLPADRPLPEPAVLSDGAVTLRAPAGDDLAVLPSLVDHEVLAWTGVPGRSPAALEKWLDQFRRPLRPPEARFAVTEGSNQMLGCIGLSREIASQSIVLGWWLGPQARGRGIAQRGVRLALEWAAAIGGVRRFSAGIFDGNLASIALAERLGFQCEGLRRACWPARRSGAARRDTWLYSLVPADPGWPDAAVRTI